MQIQVSGNGQPGLIDQAVLHQFFAQGIAVEPQHRRGFRLVAAALGHHAFEQRLFNLVQHHIVNAARGFTIQIFEILADIVRHTIGNVMSFIRHIIFFIVLVISRPSESLFTRKHISSLQ